MCVQEAFAGDDVVSEFVREKEAEVKRGQNKDVDLTLPGSLAGTTYLRRTIMCQ